MNRFKFRTPCKCNQCGFINFLVYSIDFGEIKNINWLKSSCSCNKLEMQNGYVKIGDEEQYTGLNDKNGKEIYEGDIIGIPSKGKRICLGTVEFDKYSGYKLKWSSVMQKFKDAVYSDGMPGNLDIKGSPWEVAGNIHENTELLKANKNG